MNNSTYAYCATAFFVALGFAIMLMGDALASRLVILAFSFAALSQFSAQGNHWVAYQVANAFVAVGMFFITIAVLQVTFAGN